MTPHPRTLSLVSVAWLAAVGSAACTPPPGDPNGDPTRYQPPPGEWQLVWSDEFEAEAGTPPDSDNWTHDVGTDWGNAQLEFDTDRTQNAFQDGEGHLVIRALHEEYQGSEYTSARIHTRDNFSHQYGRFEARLQLPEGRGLWPAFWMLGANFRDVGWPDCGEIDVMEARGQEPEVVHGSAHGPGYSGSTPLTRSYTLPSGVFSDDLHVFAVEWTPDAISWFVDDHVYHVRSPDDSDFHGKPWVFDQPFFVILNVAVGGRYVGPPDETTEFPQDMLVDYVRVYSQ